MFASFETCFVIGSETFTLYNKIMKNEATGEKWLMLVSMAGHGVGQWCSRAIFSALSAADAMQGSSGN